MATTNTNDIVNLLNSLRVKLESSLPSSLVDSQFFIDISDIYEICIDYTEAIDLIISPEINDSEKLVNILYTIDCHLFEHLEYHTKSLKKLLPQIIKSIETNGFKKSE